MSDYTNKIMADVKAKNPSEPEFHQAVEEVMGSLELVFTTPSGISLNENFRKNG